MNTSLGNKTGELEPADTALFGISDWESTQIKVDGETLNIGFANYLNVSVLNIIETGIQDRGVWKPVVPVYWGLAATTVSEAANQRAFWRPSPRPRPV